MSRLLVNACPRGAASRTLRLAEHATGLLGGGFERLDVYREGIVSLTPQTLEKRLALCAEGRFDDPLFAPARRFREAETVVIAAPYWDLSFPAALKALVEQL